MEVGLGVVSVLAAGNLCADTAPEGVRTVRSRMSYSTWRLSPSSDLHQRSTPRRHIRSVLIHAYPRLHPIHIPSHPIPSASPPHPQPYPHPHPHLAAAVSVSPRWSTPRLLGVYSVSATYHLRKRALLGFINEPLRLFQNGAIPQMAVGCCRSAPNATLRTCFRRKLLR